MSLLQVASPVRAAPLPVGDQHKFGFPRIENAAWTVAPLGWSSSRIALTHSIYYPDQNGAAVWFAFDQTYAAPAVANVAFHFSGDTLAAGVSAGEGAKFGVAGVANAARTVAPQGTDSGVVPRAGRVWPSVANCEFRTKLDRDSRATWTVIPAEAGHRFQDKLDSWMA